MKFLIIFLLFNSINAFAKLDLKPGKWIIKIEQVINGKKIDPLSELNKKIASLPKEQQEKMKAMMAKMNKGNALSSSQHFCVKKDQYDKKKLLESIPKDCKVYIINESTSEFHATFKCDNSQEGSLKIKLIDPKKYEMTYKSIQNKQVTELKGYGTWFSDECNLKVSN